MTEDIQAWVEEELHPDLQPFVIEHPALGPYVHHPLVIGTALIPGVLNHQYRQKVERLTDSQAWEPGYIWLFEKPYRLEFFNAWYLSHRVSVEDLRQYLPDLWTSTEFPLGSDDDGEWLINLFREIGFYSDNGWAAPKQPMPIFRGGRQDGMSWTLDRRVATFFAKRFNPEQPLPLYSAIAPPESVLAVFMDARGESEVVVDPSLLTEVEEIAI